MKTQAEELEPSNEVINLVCFCDHSDHIVMHAPQCSSVGWDSDTIWGITTVKEDVCVPFNLATL